MSRLINCLNDSKKKIIFNALVKSQFSYCPLVWMSCSRQTNNMINKTHERALRIVLNDHFSDFETMLLNMNDITIYHRNIQTLMIELFQIKYDLAPPIMDSLLDRRTIQKFARASIGKKENCVLWFRNNKLPRTSIMDNFSGRV